MNNLQCEKIYFENISYKRTGISENAKVSTNIKKVWYSSDEDKSLFKLVLKLDCKLEDNFDISIDLAGVFKIEADSEEQKEIYMQNAVVILMPYLRSELTLITSQPDIKPVVLPLINFKK